GEEDSNQGKNELDCPECKYRSRSVKGWETHIARNHSTSPALRCDCGHESHSNVHSYECEISNFTIIRNGDGPIRRLTDTPVS
ncbi:hypothetical protein PMAYCL1PPCAC_14246, partial [Pristionchus mayeri]